jgi:hypothetical protein
MKHPSLALVAALAATLVPLGSVARAACDDPAAAEAVRAQIGETCICDAASNHGRYVSCVAREVRQAVADDALPKNCKGAVMRCAARSTCGKKSGFVTCCFASPGHCKDGTCQDGSTSCTVDADCPQVSRCRTKSSADHCTASGGSPGTGSCCDAVCAVSSPSGAFID